MNKIRKNSIYLYRSIIAFFFFIITISGCSFTTLSEGHLTELARHKKYPLKVAVEIGNIKEISKRSYTIHETYYAALRKHYCYYSDIYYACKEFFPTLFDHVDFVMESNLETNKYDLFIYIDPKLTEGSKRKDIIEFDINFEFQKPNGETIIRNAISSVGKGLLTRDSSDRSYYLCGITDGTRKVFQQLGQFLTQRPNAIDTYIGQLALLKQREMERKTLPANLVAKSEYSDKTSFLPNNMIDAGEESLIALVINNTGKGTAFDVEMNIESDYENIQFPKTTPIGNIEPGQSREVSVNIKAGLGLTTGTAPFSIICKEKRGYDARKISVLIPAVRLEKPKLLITSYRINDGNTGLAKGNDNGILENGETIEITAFIRNEGVGNAVGVSITLEELSPGLEVTQKQTSIGTVAPRQTARGQVAFQIPRTYSSSAEAISFKVAASDVRLGPLASQKGALSYETNQPILAYSSGIFRRGKQVTSVSNGETVELEITPVNEGLLAAQNVELSVRVPDLNYTSLNAKIGILEPKSSGISQRFRLQIPRTFTNSKLPVHISLEQSGFSGKDATIELPVAVTAPRLRYTATISGKHGGNNIEQGERASLGIQIQNTGNLDAANVRVKLGISNPEVKIMGKHEVVIPKIPRGSFSETINFDLLVLRKVKPGRLPIQISVDQSDFPSEDFEHELMVKAERAKVVEVAGTSRDVVTPSGSPYSLAPILALARPQNGLRTYENRLDLSGTVADAKGIDRISVEVNGRQVPVRVRDTSSINRKEFVANLPLKEGRNKIVITAYNIDNVAGTDTRFVYKELTAAKGPQIPPLSLYCDVDRKTMELPVVTRPDYSRWAVVIGVEKYRNAPSVPYAIRDAQAVKEYFTRLFSIPDENSFVLFNDQATLGELLDLIEDRLPSLVKRGDVVYFYFAGHGVPHVGDGTPYLLPYDGKPSNPKRTAYSSANLYASLGKLRAKNVFVFMDACFSGAAGRSDDRLLIEGRPAGLVVKDPVLAQKNMILFAATGPKQISNAYRDKQHGLFTYYLLKGLGGDLPAGKGKAVTVNDLARNVQSNVYSFSRKQFGPNMHQKPEIKGIQGKENLIIVGPLP